jgi:hypothetical protein
MKNINLKKSLVALTTSALIAAFAVVIPTTAQAAPTCDDQTVLAGKSSTSITFKKCVGTDFQGANYEIRMPKKFNGTLFLYSHGIRHSTVLPQIPVINPSALDIATGYPEGWRSKLRTFPEVAPGRSPADQETIARTLLSQGYALAGASPRVGGWAVPEHIEANMNLLEEAKTLFPKINKIVSWGDSLGGHISQSMSEQFDSIDAAINLHMAGSADVQFSQLGDVIWLTKTLFDPTIKGHGYENRFPGDPDGYNVFITDIYKVLGVLQTLQANIQKNPVTPAWPDTAPASLKASPIPVRSAIMLLGLLAGIPPQSTTYDASSGPAGPLETTFGLAVNPAVAVLENYSSALGLGILAGYDAQIRCGGVVYDNTKTDYAARLGDNRYTWATALSGNTSINGMLAYLSPLNPAAPRVKGDADAIDCINNQSKYNGKVSTPTITLSQTADAITPAGYVEKFKNLYQGNVSAKEAKPGLLLNIWNKPPDTYTKFSSAGLPITPAVPTTGTSHFMFTNEQIMAMAKLGAAAAKSGKLPSTKTALAAFKKDASIFIDPDFTPALMPQEK